MELGNKMFLTFLPQLPSSLSSVSLLCVLWMKHQGQKSYRVKNCALFGQGGAWPDAFTVQGGNVSPTCRYRLRSLVSLFLPQMTPSRLSVQFSRLVVSDSLRPHESQHARPPCPSLSPGVHSDSHPSSP